MLWNGYLRGIVFAAAALLTANAAKAADLIIGVPHWSSAQATAHILAEALRKERGVDLKLRDMGTLGIIKAMDRGDVHIHPQIWLPFSDRVLREHGTVVLSLKGVPAKQNICVTHTAAEEHGIASVEDLKDRNKAALFDTDGDGLGEIWIGARTWASTPIERIRARSYGFDKTMTLLEADEQVAMAAVDVAVATARPMVFVCYQPHHMFKLHDVRLLEEPEHDPDQWRILFPNEDSRWFQKSSAAVAWKEAHFHIGYIEELAEREPELTAFLDAVDFDITDVVAMTYALHVERQSPAEFARRWVEENPDRVASWFE